MILGKMWRGVADAWEGLVTREGIAMMLLQRICDTKLGFLYCECWCWML